MSQQDELNEPTRNITHDEPRKQEPGVTYASVRHHNIQMREVSATKMWMTLTEVNRSDKELLDALEECGDGIALLHDDEDHWYVVGNGTQEIVIDGPLAFQTSYWIEKEDVPYARKTAREAIEAWLDRD